MGQPAVVCDESLEILSERKSGSQVEGVERSQTCGRQLSGSFENAVVQSDECDTGQRFLGASASRGAQG